MIEVGNTVKVTQIDKLPGGGSFKELEIYVGELGIVERLSEYHKCCPVEVKFSNGKMYRFAEHELELV